jgi:hypothetical protein
MRPIPSIVLPCAALAAAVSPTLARAADGEPQQAWVDVQTLADVADRDAPTTRDLGEAITRWKADQRVFEALRDAPQAFEFAGQPLKTAPATFLGVQADAVDATTRAQLDLPDGMGLAVASVDADSPAAKAGLQPHDVMQKLDDQLLVNGEQLAVLVRARKPGDEVTLTVFRKGKPTQLKASLVQRELPVLGSSTLTISGQPLRINMQPPPLAIPAPGPGGLNVMRLRPGAHSTVVSADGDQTVRIEIRDGHKTIEVTGADGKPVFSGPIDTPDQLKSLPESVHVKVQAMLADAPLADDGANATTRPTTGG